MVITTYLFLDSHTLALTQILYLDHEILLSNSECDFTIYNSSTLEILVSRKLHWGIYTVERFGDYLQLRSYPSGGALTYQWYWKTDTITQTSGNSETKPDRGSTSRCVYAYGQNHYVLAKSSGTINVFVEEDGQWVLKDSLQHTDCDEIKLEGSYLLSKSNKEVKIWNLGKKEEPKCFRNIAKPSVNPINNFLHHASISYQYILDSKSFVESYSLEDDSSVVNIYELKNNENIPVTIPLPPGFLTPNYPFYHGLYIFEDFLITNGTKEILATCKALTCSF